MLKTNVLVKNMYNLINEIKTLICKLNIFFIMLLVIAPFENHFTFSMKLIY